MENKPQEIPGPAVDFAVELKALLIESNQWAKQVIDRHKEELQRLQGTLGIDMRNLSGEDEHRMMRAIFDRMENPQDLQEYDKWALIYSAALSHKAIAVIRVKDVLDAECLFQLYLLGCAHGAVADLGHWPTKLFEDHFHREKSKRAIRGRWEERDSLLEEIRSEADRRWREGSTDFHHDMANKLEKHFGHRKPKISVKVIRKAILPTAKAYGRARGVKE